jgi:glycosyltransferase involved in cell wall biosynthesis
VAVVNKHFILLIPCYNNFKGLLASLKSVHYPFNLFEVLIIDDGSFEIINEKIIHELYPLLLFKIIRLPVNSGIVTALNTGLSVLHARNDYTYIARLDCGDICQPDRFTKQISFLKKNPNIALLGSWCSFSNPTIGKSYLYKTKINHHKIINEMHIKCSFIHPTVMFKKEVMDKVGYYPTNFPHAEDYAFFWDILNYFEGAIIPENLVTVEMSTGNISSKNFKEQIKSKKAVINAKGSSFWYKLIGLSILNIKSIMPLKFIEKLKLYFNALDK